MDEAEGALRDSYQGVRIDYSVEETPLGTGGAFRKAISARSWETRTS